MGKIKDSKHTKDGHQVELAANIGTPKDLRRLFVNNGLQKGVGYTVQNSYTVVLTMPAEEDQLRSLQGCFRRHEWKGTCCRSLWISVGIKGVTMPLPRDEPIPGYRAIRISLNEPGNVPVHNCALLRASVYGKLRIMFPMIATLNDFRGAKALLEEKAKLIEGVAVR